MGTKIVCLTITSQLGHRPVGTKEGSGRYPVMQKQEKTKIRQPSLALSPEHLQRKGRKQSCPLDYVF